MTYTEPITDCRRLLTAKPKHDILASAWNWEMLHPDRRRDVTDRAKAALAKMHFDAIAVTGISGLVIGSVIAMEMDKPLIIVRKRGEERHSGYDVEGAVSVATYVILDDFISSGSTILRIERKIRTVAGAMHAPRCIGVLEYGSCCPRWTPRREWSANAWYESKHERVW